MLSHYCLVWICHWKDRGPFSLIALSRHSIFTCLLVLSHNFHDWTSCSSFSLSTNSQLELGENFWSCSEITSRTPCPMGSLSQRPGWSPMALRWCWGTPGSNQRGHSVWHSEQGWLCQRFEKFCELKGTKKSATLKIHPWQDSFDSSNSHFKVILLR